MLFVVCCLLIVGWCLWLLFVYWDMLCSLVVVSGLLRCALLFAVCYVLFVVCCRFFTVCSLFIVA